MWCQLFRLFHSFKNITQLICSQNNIGKCGVLLANAVSELVRLRALYLNSCAIPEDQCIQIIRSLSKCKQLTHLILSGNKLNSSGGQLTKTIQQWGMDCPLQSLYLHNCSIRLGHCSTTFQCLHLCTNLTELSMTRNCIGTAGNVLSECINQWGEEQKLQRIYIDDCGIPEVQCSQILQSLSECKQLTHLTLSGNKVRNAGEYLANTIQQYGIGPSLQSLHLDNCSIPEEHCSTILQSLHSYTYLTELGMDGNTIGTAGKFLVESIKHWGEKQQLQRIYIKDCDIPEVQCCQILQSLSKCKLKGLFVRECAEGSRCSHKTLCVCVWGKVLASGERGFQE